MSLRTENTIFVPTKAGEYQIQLCYGDITRVEEKMDIVMVSAFPGDYSAVGGTLIGALKRNLGLDVGKLAKNKDMDLRVHFSCWMSKELDPELPYKRLLCFERSRAKGDVIDQIREMFRVFVPAFGNQETTVITPLLGTGNQGIKESVVLSCMVEAAQNWMKAGLPMKCIKLVIYDNDNSELNELFQSMKKKFMPTGKNMLFKIKKKELTYDVFITYEENDKQWVPMVTNMLKSKGKDLKIYSELQEFDENKVWQDSIFKVMACSQRIIALLTPSFVNSKKCIDLFNMAMCCNRLKNSELLFPFLMTTVDSMPVYMKLVQYFDCRIRKEGDVIDGKLHNACSFVMNPTSGGYKKSDDDTKDANERFKYDVFISYSHKQPKQAEELLQKMTTANSDLKIFFDRSELTMGSMWQSTLYESLDRSECIVALVSPQYFSSTVCQEEYNIALARHLSYPTGILFIPVLVEPMETIPSKFSRICIIDATRDKFDRVTEDLTQKIVNWRLNKTRIPYIHKPVDKFSFSSIESKRKSEVENKYKLNTKMKCLDPYTSIGTITPSKSEKIDIAVSFARDAVAYAGTLNFLFDKNNQDLNISFLNENTQGSLQDLDTARQIIVILSKEYVQSSHHMQELHVALGRQRESKKKLVVRILADKNLPENPMFIHLLPFGTVLSDAVWTRYGKKTGSLNEQKTVMSYKSGMRGSFSMPYGTYYAMEKMAYDVMTSLCRSKDTEDEIQPIICNILEAKLKDIDYPPTVEISECLVDVFSENQNTKIKKVNDTKEPIAEETEDANARFIRQKTSEANEENAEKEKPVAVKWADENNSHINKPLEKKEILENLECELENDSGNEKKESSSKSCSITTSKEKEDNAEKEKPVVVKWDEENNTNHIKKALEMREIMENLQYELENDSANEKTEKKKPASKSCSIL